MIALMVVNGFDFVCKARNEYEIGGKTHLINISDISFLTGRIHMVINNTPSLFFNV